MAPELDDPLELAGRESVPTDGEDQVHGVVRHDADPSCWQLAWLMVRVLAVSVVLGLVLGIILGWGSVVVVQVK
jgi:ABC-type amino acid transport system permease subunit